MNQLSKGEKLNALTPLQIQTPSMSNVLETLNLINGIVFVHISQEDIERFREEMIRHQAQVGQGQGQKSSIEPDSKPNEEDQTSSSDSPPVVTTKSDDFNKGGSACANTLNGCADDASTLTDSVEVSR